MELVRVEKRRIGNEEINSVSARELHEFLEINTPFSMWIKRRLEEYSFLESTDFISHKIVTQENQLDRIEYYLTIDTAKELAMVEKTEKGREIRKYFIDCEKRLRDIVKPKGSKALLASEEVKQIHTNVASLSPRLAQYLIDHCVSEILEVPVNQIEEPKLRGVVEIAESLGLPVSTGNRSQLGKFVKSRVGHLAKMEERLVNGTMREVACYPDIAEVQGIISSYFNALN